MRYVLRLNTVPGMQEEVIASFIIHSFNVYLNNRGISILF